MKQGEEQMKSKSDRQQIKIKEALSGIIYGQILIEAFKIRLGKTPNDDLVNEYLNDIFDFECKLLHFYMLRDLGQISKSKKYKADKIQEFSTAKYARSK
jgi:hypothetical protein